MPDGALQARARVLQYIKANKQGLNAWGACIPELHALLRFTRCKWKPNSACSLSPTAPLPNHMHPLPQENDLWGATPFATFVHMGLHNWAAWNATAAAATSALLADGAGDSPGEFEAMLSKAAGPALDSLHKVVCIAYYLPDKRVGKAVVGRAGSTG